MKPLSPRAAALAFIAVLSAFTTPSFLKGTTTSGSGGIGITPAPLWVTSIGRGEPKDPAHLSEAPDPLTPRQAAPVPDSSVSHNDTLALSRTKPARDTAGNPDLKSVRTAMLLSLFIPGGGQFYNESYWKAGIIAAAEVTLASLSIREQLLMTDISKTLPQDSTSRNLISSYRDRRNAFAFFTGVVIIYSLSDAYVDAHMFHFREQQTLSLVPAHQGLGLSLKLNF